MDRHLFQDLVVRTERSIRAYLAGMGVPLGDVDDIAQEVYLVHFRQDSRVGPGADEVAWLKGIARNLALQFFRSRARRERPLTELAEVLEATEVTWKGDDEARLDALRRCLSGLEERQVAMVTAYYAEGVPSHGVGERFQLTPEAVRIAMMRLRERLRDCIRQRLAQERTA